MNRKLLIAAIACLLVVPTFAETREPRTEQAPSALHLMNQTEFTSFLKRLDSAQVDWQAQLRKFNLSSLRLGPQDRQQLQQSYSLCLDSLDNVRQQVQELSQQQTLQGDLLLLVDMNELARNLDELDRDLANAAFTGQTGSSAQKSLRYVHEVLGIDAALASHTAAFRNHVFAFAKLIDAKLADTDDEPSASVPQS